MSNKRGEISILLGFILILFLIFVFFISPVSSVSDKDKIDEKVYEMLEKSDDVRVVVKIEEPAVDTGFLIKTKKTDYEISLEKQEIKEEIINNVGEENIKHVFDKEIAVEISKDDLVELNNNPNVESVVIDKLVHAFLQDSVPLINATKVWPIQISNINITGTGETVCIIDTGINKYHADLQGKVVAEYCYCTLKEGTNSNCCPDGTGEDNNATDNNGHGTHVAGIVAASGGINGVAINASLVVIKALNSSGAGIDTDIKAAIDWCVNNASVYNISVISMSLGGGAYSTYCDAGNSLTSSINAAIGKNISVIAATGNDGDHTNIASPACIENVTSVGATTKVDAIASYSNRNSITDLFAPGGTANNGVNGINSTSISGGYTGYFGTSMATPHVAGAFALIRQMYRLLGITATPSQIKNLLNSTGKQIYDSSTGLNFSRINIYSAINSILEINVTLVSPADNTYINLANQNQSFICNITSNYNLMNITFYLWNSTNNLINSSNKTISGTSNSTTFNYNFTNENSYHWNCIAYNSQGLANSNSNFTITYDITKPIISSISVSPSTTTATVTWTTNENSNSSVNYGTTTGLGSFSTSSTMTTSNSISLSSLSSSTTYYYNVTSCDTIGNCVTNGTNSFTTSAETPVQTNSPGGGGSGTPKISAKIYEPTIAEISSISGYTKTLAKDDKIKFTFFDEKNENHTLTVTTITSNSISLTIQSNPIKLTLGIGQSVKLNLTSRDYYNFYIKLNSITNNKADVTIQTINEQIPKQSITGNIVKENEDKTIEETPKQKKTNIGGYIKDFLIVILIIAVLVILFSRTDKTRTERIKKYREKFRELHPRG